MFHLVACFIFLHLKKFLKVKLRKRGSVLILPIFFFFESKNKDFAPVEDLEKFNALHK